MKQVAGTAAEISRRLGYRLQRDPALKRTKEIMEMSESTTGQSFKSPLHRMSRTMPTCFGQRLGVNVRTQLRHRQRCRRGYFATPSSP